MKNHSGQRLSTSLGTQSAVHDNTCTLLMLLDLCFQIVGQLEADVNMSSCAPAGGSLLGVLGLAVGEEVQSVLVVCRRQQQGITVQSLVSGHPGAAFAACTLFPPVHASLFAKDSGAQHGTAYFQNQEVRWDSEQNV